MVDKMIKVPVLDAAVHSACCFTYFFTTRCSYASAVLGVVILSVWPSIHLSVHPSVCHTHALWLIQRTYQRYFYTTWKGNPSSFLMPKISEKFQ